MKILECYPFRESDGIEIAEGFTVYDGNLGDKVGASHKGIDYVKKDDFGRFHPFSVHAAHSGEAVCGFEESFGFFVLIRQFVGFKPVFFQTIYAHLKEMLDLPTRNIAEVVMKRDLGGKKVEIGQQLGFSGITGWTNDIPQLHFELLEIDWNSRCKSLRKVDPYGVYDRLSSDKYPQPGRSLSSLQHYWTHDIPKFA